MFFNLLTIFNKNENKYPYEVTKRSGITKFKLKKEKNWSSLKKKKPIKTKLGRKRYGQNNINKKSYLNKRKIINQNYSSWNNTSKQQKALNKFKHKPGNRSIKNINSLNDKNNVNNFDMDYEKISEDCKTVFSIMNKWQIDMSWVNIDLGDDGFFNKTNKLYYPCCYNNNYVVCEDNKVAELNFQENEIEGEIPEEICDLPDLTKLFLGTNRLYGGIPENIKNLKKLEYLWLYYNNLNGTIPSSIGDLSNLKSLNLHGNDFSGEIPSEIGELTNLETLDLHNNDFEGDIPSMNKTNLKRLYLNDNHLNITDVPSMPDTLEKCEFKNNLMSESVYKSFEKSLNCTSAAISGISAISIQGILLLLIINIIINFK